MDNLKITKIAAQMDSKRIPLTMLKGRVFNENHSVEEIVAELENDYKDIQVHVESGEQLDYAETMNSLKEWGGNKND